MSYVINKPPPQIMSPRQQFRHGTDKTLEMSSKTKPDVTDLWIRHQRRNTKTTQSWACIYCPHRKICLSEIDLWNHAEKDHRDKIPSDQDELKRFRKSYESNSAQKRSVYQGTLTPVRGRDRQGCVVSLGK